jgi:hypothetical protein
MTKKAEFPERSSALIVTFVSAKKPITMSKGTHFIGQPMYGQLLNLLEKQKSSKPTVRKEASVT